MKTFSLSEPSSILSSAPQEDYFLISKKLPIFVVADGVTLVLERGQKYPAQSGAADAAKIFCQTVIREAEKRYANFEKGDIKKIFNIANKTLAEYNLLNGRTEKKINYLDVDFFSVTTAFVLLKGKKAYWWSLCDSGVSVLDKSGNETFCTPSQSPTEGKFLPRGWKKMKSSERAVIMHKSRNKVGESEELLGYGVADGEKEAENYLNFGTLDLKDGNLVIIYTDGFKNYLHSESFKKIFSNWSANLSKKIERLMKDKIKESRTKYGLERSLIAALIE